MFLTIEKFPGEIGMSEGRPRGKPKNSLQMYTVSQRVHTIEWLKEWSDLKNVAVRRGNVLKPNGSKPDGERKSYEPYQTNLERKNEVRANVPNFRRVTVNRQALQVLIRTPSPVSMPHQ